METYVAVRGKPNLIEDLADKITVHISLAFSLLS